MQSVLLPLATATEFRFRSSAAPKGREQVAHGGRWRPQKAFHVASDRDGLLGLASGPLMRMESSAYGTFAQDEDDEFAPLGCDTAPQTFEAYTSRPAPKFNPSWWWNSIRGAEWFHLYLWMLKDFLWTQDTYAFGIVAGFAASAWSIFLLVRSIRHGNGVEAWHYTAQFIWLFANAWWMYGELTDWRYPHLPKIQPLHQKQAGYMMLFAWIWLFLYYAVLQHLSLFAPLFTSSPHATAMYNEEHLHPRAWMKSFFPTWRSYENVHIFFWLAKDTSWNHNWSVPWIVFSIPTVLVALDFVWQTAHVKGGLVNHIHYLMQFLWVMANLVWAYGELFLPLLHDDPMPLFPLNLQDFHSMRWLSSWILVVAFILGVVLHVVWIAKGTEFPPTYSSLYSAR